MLFLLKKSSNIVHIALLSIVFLYSPVYGQVLPADNNPPAQSTTVETIGAGDGALCEIESLDPCPTDDTDMGSSPGSLLPNSSVGNPINLMTGNKYQEETDFQLPNTQLMLRRMYNTGSADANVGFGYGWRHSYAVALFDAGNGKREILQSNGSRVSYYSDGEDEDGNSLMRSDQSSNGYIVVKNDQHHWHVGDGRTLIFHGSYLVRIQWPDQRYLQLFYRFKRLESVTDETGRSIVFAYNESLNGRLEEFGERRFDAAANHIANVTLPDGSIIGYDYDTNKNLTRVRFPDGTHREYHYEDEIYQNHITGITDRTGVRFATWAYDEYGRGALSEHAGGIERVRIEYPSRQSIDNGEVVQTLVTNSLGDTSTYIWQRQHGIEESRLLMTEGAGCVTCPPTGYQYTYDDSGRLLTSRKTGLGSAVGAGGLTYRYDEQGRMAEIRRIDAGSVEHLVQRREYEGLSLTPVRTFRPSVNPDGEYVIETEQDERGRLTRVVEKGWAPVIVDVNAGVPVSYESVERSSTFTYENNHLVAINGARDDVDDITRISWDNLNRPISFERPGSPIMRLLTIDSIGRVTSFQAGSQSPVNIQYGTSNQVDSVEQRGRTIEFTYDGEGRLTSFTSPDGAISRIFYSDAGLLTKLVDVNGRTTTFETDSEGRRISSNEFGLDGVLIQSVDTLFDTLGRLSSTYTQTLNASGNMTPLQHERSYNENGRLTSVTNSASGERVALNYDVFGALASITEPADAAAESGGIAESETRFEYDAAGNEVALIDAGGNRTQYLKDDFGRVVALVSPDTGLTLYQYDAANNRISKLDAGGIEIRYRWDSANRMVAKELPDGILTYSYSVENGRIIESVAPDTTERFGYDAEARLVRHERQIDDRAFVTEYRYDKNDRLAGKTLPDGQTLRYHYREDELGIAHGTLRAITRTSLMGLRQETLIDQIDQNIYDGESGHTASNGFRTTSTFAPDGSIVSLDVDQVMTFEYEFDSGGRIVGIDMDGTKQRYDYSHAGLSAFDNGDAVYRFEYDLLGNRTSELVEFADGSIEAIKNSYSKEGEGNRLIQTETFKANKDGIVSPVETVLPNHKVLNYNSSGAPLLNAGLTYEYNSDNRPIRVLKNGAVLAEYRYNGFGERIKKITHSSNAQRITYFLYDGSKLTAEIDAESGQYKQAVFLGEAPVSYIVGQDIYAVHADHLGTPRIVTDSDGEAVWSAEYLPHGEATLTISQLDLPYRFPGQYFDTETETHYNYYRDYDPATGRYITSDPIGLQGGLNTYAYALNNPLMLTDPLGLAPGDPTGGQNGEPIKPDPEVEQAYSDKLTKVFKYTIENLKKRPGKELAVKFMEDMLAEIAVVAAIVATLAAAHFLGVGLIADGVLLAAGWLLAGYEAGKFLAQTISSAIALNSVDLCNEDALKAMGDGFADSIVNLGSALASNALLGGLSKISGVLKDAGTFVSDGAWATWKKIKRRFAGACSFAGSTLVVTRNGYRKIKDIEAGQDEVWARDEYTGRSGWRSVLAQYFNRYEHTVRVTARNESGGQQTIVSNRIHPYFARIAAGALIATSSVAVATEGYIYDGDIVGGAWVDAQHLQVGDQLLSDNNSWQTVELVEIEAKPIDAYNLTVDEYSTYFVAGDVDADAVWVHNSCADKLPEGYKYSGSNTPFGQPKFTDANGKVWYRGHDGRFYDIDAHPPSAKGQDGPPRELTAFQKQFDGVSDVNNPAGQNLSATGGNSTNLGANMDSKGFNRPPNSDAHHIIPAEYQNRPFARDLRRLLDDAGIDINEAANGVYLPTNRHHPDWVAPNHKRVHSSAYFTALHDRLKNFSSDNPDAIRNELQKIAKELSNNTFTW